MRINTNINSMRTQEYMRQNQAKMSNAMDRLSSGKRINNASDDAAGLAIATRMRARESGLNVAANNTQDGISLIRTADSALNSVSNILLRMRDIANQSANGTNTDTNQAALQKEFGELQKQIDYISNNTQFNDKKLLNGDSSTINIQTLDSDDKTKQIGIELSNTSIQALGIKDLKIGAQAPDLTELKDAFTNYKTLKDATSPATAAPALAKAKAEAKAAYDKLATDFVNIKDSLSAASTTAVGTTYPAANTDIDPVVAALMTSGEFEKAEKAFKENPPTTGVDANNAIKKIDTAIEQIASNRATLGATLNRLDFNVNNLKSQSSSMASAASQIEDADMAKEMSEMTKFKILNEAGISMLSQANQTPQMVSKLLQ
ncbi:flagellin [Bacillus wiedmannii]|uniref:flagellin N-terminal helical domain-containing protein n=2 Tax=Bacillus wiedmannii TaxID=1890302 RepID=UPI00065BF9A2|nr:flagellin [Bacillus wiedmannii]KMP95418.1 flagellin [Bacillus wiedmannii]OUB37240.1 flagellin [Bacillus thuringiensis serovar argentinensis]